MKKVAAIKRVEKKAKNEVKGHKTAIQSLSISTDGKFLASGDQENQVYIWVTFKTIVNLLLFILNQIYIIYRIPILWIGFIHLEVTEQNTFDF